jgi:hypothetical protein
MAVLVLVIMLTLLYVCNIWLANRGECLTFSLGKHIETINPTLLRMNHINVEVVNKIENVRPENPNDAEIEYLLYSGTAVFTFTNFADKECRLHLPLLRAGYLTSNSNEFIFSKDLKAVWKETRTINLKPGESFLISHEIEGFSDRKQFGSKTHTSASRWQLVFGVPDGEDPDKYVVGTVLTNPIHWVFLDNKGK